MQWCLLLLTYVTLGVPGWITPGLSKLSLTLLVPRLFNRRLSTEEVKVFPFHVSLRHTGICLQLSSKPPRQDNTTQGYSSARYPHLYPRAPSSCLLWVCRNKFIRCSYNSWYFQWDWVLVRILLLNQPLFFPNFLSSSVTPSILLFSAATKGGRAARQRS